MTKTQEFVLAFKKEPAETCCRILVAIVLFIPSAILMYTVYSILGVLLTIWIIAIPMLIISSIFGDEKAKEDLDDDLHIIGEFFSIPFLFWYYFIVGKPPLQQPEFKSS